jgi:hypothetical protein
MADASANIFPPFLTFPPIFSSPLCIFHPFSPSFYVFSRHFSPALMNIFSRYFFRLYVFSINFSRLYVFSRQYFPAIFPPP